MNILQQLVSLRSQEFRERSGSGSMVHQGKSADAVLQPKVQPVQRIEDCFKLAALLGHGLSDQGSRKVASTPEGLVAIQAQEATLAHQAGIHGGQGLQLREERGGVRSRFQPAAQPAAVLQAGMERPMREDGVILPPVC